MIIIQYISNTMKNNYNFCLKMRVTFYHFLELSNITLPLNSLEMIFPFILPYLKLF